MRLSVPMKPIYLDAAWSKSSLNFDTLYLYTLTSSDFFTFKKLLCDKMRVSIAFCVFKYPRYLTRTHATNRIYHTHKTLT